jgi:hypothetical protein
LASFSSLAVPLDMKIPLDLSEAASYKGGADASGRDGWTEPQ